VRAAYNRAQFNAERRRLLEAWAAYLEGREAGSNIVAWPGNRDTASAKIA
jgi:hypothetical protein